MTNEKTKENLKSEFVAYLVEDDIKNDNGLKTLEDLQQEYPIEWENFVNTFYD